MKRMATVAYLFSLCLTGCGGQPPVEQKSQTATEKKVAESKSSAKEKSTSDQNSVPNGGDQKQLFQVHPPKNQNHPFSKLHLTSR